MKKRSFFPVTKTLRLAPLQEKMLAYMVTKFPSDFDNESDYIRKAITLQAKNKLSAAEYEFVCQLAYKDMPVEVDNA